jgi:NTP pyrophosphatase (non-canonical NTP hydrolase)
VQSATFTTLREANVARQQEWDADNQITATYRATELAGELGEACNVVKKLERERLGIRGSRDTVKHLAEELADIIICVDLLAMSYGINLDAAVAAKFNATSEKIGLKTRLCLSDQSELTRAREREKELVEALDNLASHAATMRKKLAGANLPTGYADHEAIRDAERLVATSALAGGKP